VLFTVIFFVGEKLGGNARFKKTFSVRPYCLTPAIIGALSIPLALTFVSQIPFTEVEGGAIDLDHKSQIYMNFLFIVGCQSAYTHYPYLDTLYYKICALIRLH